MAATKEQERQALQKIRKIVEDLGEDSYIGMAFEGVWEIAEDNIENDFGNSCKWYVDNFHQTHDAYTKLVESHCDEVRELETELARRESIISEQEMHFQMLERSYEALSVESFDKSTEIRLLKDKVDFSRTEVVELKAKLYDLMFSGK